MPHERAISKIFRAAFRFVPGLVPALAASVALLAPSVSAAPPTPNEAGTLRAALERMYRMDYAAAESLLAADTGRPSAALVYHAGVAALNRFLDWGDTAALGRAERRWERLSPRGGGAPRFPGEDAESLRLYRGLAGFQLSYLASLRGQAFRAATLALAARNRLRDPAPLPDPEARAALMLYDYYRGRLLERLPFVGAPGFPVADFLEAAEAAPASRETLLFSLFWIHVEARRFDAAQAIVDGFLSRHPENRMARELRGSLLFRRGNPEGAREEYEKLRGEYAAVARVPGRLPLGYYRAVGNLVRVHASQGDRRGAEALRAEWNRGLAGASGPWLPSGLKDEIARL